MPKKIRIIGLTDPEGNGVAGDNFDLQLNPDTIKHNRSIVVASKQVGDTAGPIVQFTSFGPETIAFDFFVDGTGVIPAEDGDAAFTSVTDKVAELEEKLYKFRGADHKPPYVLVLYGSIVMRGMITSFNVDYVLFDFEGNPLRAKISLSIQGGNEKVTPETKEAKSSPDMTHSVTIREGDSLPLLCKTIYGKMDYYLQVAQHNGLTNFRELEAGSTIEFPPLQR